MGQTEESDDWVCVSGTFHREISTTSTIDFEVFKSFSYVVVEKNHGTRQASKRAYLTPKELVDIHKELSEISEDVPAFPFDIEQPSWFWGAFARETMFDNETCLKIVRYLKKVYSLIDNELLDHIIFMEKFDIGKYFKDLQSSNLNIYGEQVDCAAKCLNEHISMFSVVKSTKDLRKFYETEDELMLKWQRALSQQYYGFKLPLYEIRDSDCYKARIKKLREFNQEFHDGHDESVMDMKKVQLDAECNISKMNAEFFSNTVSFYRDSLKRMEVSLKPFREGSFIILTKSRVERFKSEMTKDKIQELLNQRHILKLKFDFSKSQNSENDCSKKLVNLKLKLYKKNIEIKKERLSQKLHERKKMKENLQARKRMTESEMFFDAQMEPGISEENVADALCDFYEEEIILEQLNAEIAKLGTAIAKMRVHVERLDSRKDIDMAKSVLLDVGIGHQPGQVSFSPKRKEIPHNEIYEQPETTFIPPPPPLPPPPPPSSIVPLESILKVAKNKPKEISKEDKECFIMTLSMLTSAKSRLKRPTECGRVPPKDPQGFVVTVSQLNSQIAKLKPTPVPKHSDHFKPRTQETDQLNFLREAVERIRNSFDDAPDDEDQDFDDEFD